MVTSPIRYMGNKAKLVKKGLTNLFPQNIKHYYEPFAGSATVAMNVQAESYHINDSDKHLYDLYLLFKCIPQEVICTHIDLRIDEYALPKERTKRNVYHDKEKIEQYKSSYCKFRNDYNNGNRSALDFYTLMLFSFSQQFRFNSNGEYNMPFGNDCFTEQNKKYISSGCEFFSKNNVILSNESFDKFLDIDSITTDSFVYFDPPYLNTTATYNESRGSEYTWNETWDTKLQDICDTLTKRGICFAMSNVFENKGIVNDDLIEWCEWNGYQVHHFNNHTYTACGKGNANTDEVLIMNYEL